MANTDDLTNTTSAVRNYIDNASEAEKTGKKGQQQWGLFETNYQRNKGISTNESLQEIEDFCKTGVTVTNGGQEWSIAGTSSHEAGYGGRPGGQQGYSTGGNQVSHVSVQGGGLATAGQVNRSAQPGAGNLSFGDRSAGGASFFAQHQAKEAKKYQPEKKW